MSSLHIYFGPSIEAEEVIKLAPKAILHPPAKRGDILSSQLNPADWLLLIDGYYGSVPSVPHHELIEVISRGVMVAGCSSMGALRAAELGDLGMIGMGYVFDQYRLGFIDGDDEVAVLHSPVDYQLFTMPLINLRYALLNLVRAEKISQVSAENIIDSIKLLPFSERSHISIENSIRHFAKKNIADEVISRVFSNEYDIKLNDAKYAISTLNAITNPTPRNSTVFRKLLIEEVNNLILTRSYNE